MTNNKKPKVGLVLGSGAARGLSHIGVIKALEEHNIPIDFISGCSMGALVGGFYASGIPVKQLEEIALNLNIKKLVSLFRPSFTKSGIVNGSKIGKLLLGIIGDKNFSDLSIPLSVITTDAHTGKEVIINQGSVVKALRASISFPGLFVPVEFGDYFLIDGGIINPLPVSEVISMGADLTIVADASKNVGEYARYVKSKQQKKLGKIQKAKSKLNKILFKEDNIKNVLKSLFSNKGEAKKEASPEKTPISWTPNMIHVLLQTIYIMESQISALRLSQEKVDIIIKPEISHIYMLEFHKAGKLIEAGYKATKKMLGKIEEKLSTADC